jgi:hypothetical protein
LDRYGASHRVHNAWKLDQKAVACMFEDPPLVDCNRGIEQFRANDIQVGQRAFLIDAHKAAVTHHVGCEDSGQSAFHLALGSSAETRDQMYPFVDRKSATFRRLPDWHPIEVVGATKKPTKQVDESR